MSDTLFRIALLALLFLVAWGLARVVGVLLLVARAMLTVSRIWQRIAEAQETQATAAARIAEAELPVINAALQDLYWLLDGDGETSGELSAETKTAGKL
jgi:Na+-transporting methylmalonyl-CoA/oxaloacetate decarboxylase gamma subunit